MNKHSVITYISICLFLFSGMVGCERKANQPEKPKVVSKKILAETPQAAASMPPQVSETKAELTAQTRLPANTELPVDQKDVEKTAAAVPEIQSSNNSNDEERKKAAELLASISPDSQISLGAVGYDPKGKLNPFLSLFGSSQAPAEVDVSKKSIKIKRAPRTPLEKIDLSQLKLVATVRAPSGDRALVEDGAGKGYIVKKGTYMGMNSGSVIEIANDRVIVEEEVETALGEINIQKRELKLQKAPGE
jgi:type IV pilus assembly protein PilP